MLLSLNIFNNANIRFYLEYPKPDNAWYRFRCKKRNHLRAVSILLTHFNGHMLHTEPLAHTSIPQNFCTFAPQKQQTNYGTDW